MTAGFEGETAMAILKKKNRIASLDLEEQKQNKRTAILADKHRRPIISHPMAMETEKREKKNVLLGFSFDYRFFFKFKYLVSKIPCETQ